MSELHATPPVARREAVQLELTPGTEKQLEDLAADDEVAEAVSEDVEVVESK